MNANNTYLVGKRPEADQRQVAIDCKVKRTSVKIALQPLKTSLKTILKFCDQQFTRLKPLIPLDDLQWATLDLLKILVQREMSARYKGSILGNLWPLLNQLAQLLIFTYVFSIVLQVKLNLKGLPADNSFIFGLWLFAGLLPWIAFSSGLNQAATSVVLQPNLVKKVVFPLTLLPLVPVFSSLVESSFGLMLLITFTAFMADSIHPTLLLLPLVWMTQILLTAGLGFLAASLTVFIRDIPQVLAVTLNLWLYATPILYPADLIPAPFQQLVFWLNPMAAIAEMYRDITLVGTVTHWGEWAIATLVSGIVAAIGYWCYSKLRPAFADVL